MLNGINRRLFSGRPPCRDYVAFAPLSPCLPTLATLNGINCAAARLVFPLPPGGLPAFVPTENLKVFCLPNALPTGINSAVRRSADKMPFRQLVRANCGGKGIRTLDTLLRYTHFPGVLLRPLGHSSKIKTNVKKLNPALIISRLHFSPNWQTNAFQAVRSRFYALKLE